MRRAALDDVLSSPVHRARCAVAIGERARQGAAALLQRRWRGDRGDDWYQQVLRLALRERWLAGAFSSRQWSTVLENIPNTFTLLKFAMFAILAASLKASDHFYLFFV